MRIRVLWFTAVLMLMFLLPPLIARAAPQADALAGTIEAKLGGQTVLFPLLKTEIDADVDGDVASVTVRQTFSNPTTQPLNARYLFPLNHEAAVYAMDMRVGDELVRATIKKKAEAEATFKQAQREGKAAALLVQHKPNMFTQDLANLVPGLPIVITLRYVQTVPKVDDAYQLVVPLVVGPRYQPANAGKPPMSADAELPTDIKQAVSGVWALDQIPEYPPVTGFDLPPSVDPDRVVLKVHLNGGVAIRDAFSDTHALSMESKTSTRWEIGLANGRTIDNRDFILRYRLAGSRTQAGLIASSDAANDGTFSLMLEPPAAPKDDQVSSREMVFLLDCSGSMWGIPMDASRLFMHKAMAALRPTDTFRIIRFSDSATEFSAAPLTATPENIARGLRYTDGLSGEGGTEMSAGIRQALDVPAPEGRSRIVVFLTDGYIGNDFEILSMIRARIGDARLYAFGVGAGVNRFLLDEIGRSGRGFTRYLDPTSESLERVATELAERLQSPVLTDIQIDWGTLAASEVYPEAIPDLFAGQSLRIQGRYSKPGTYTITVRGKAQGRDAQLPLTVNLPETGGDGPAVPLIWARAAIKEASYQMTLPEDVRGEGQDFETLKTRVTDLGLKYSLVTKWTSFVAVSTKIVNEHPENTATLPIPLPPVAGVSPLAYGIENPPAQVAFAGAAGPEPGAGLGLAMIAMLLLMALILQRRRQANSQMPRLG